MPRELSQTEASILSSAEEFVSAFFEGEASGHDKWHTFRVHALATTLAELEDADPFAVRLAALLHDVDDAKLSPGTAEGLANAVSFMRGRGMEESMILCVCRIIKQVSFKGKDTAAPDTIEGKCVQDADRLDAIGAIGVARTFAYGGSRGRAMYDPATPPRADMTEAEYRASNSTSINHFYEKLLLLEDLMNTPSAKAIARERTEFMKVFLDRFFNEWNGEL